MRCVVALIVAFSLAAVSPAAGRQKPPAGCIYLPAYGEYAC